MVSWSLVFEVRWIWVVAGLPREARLWLEHLISAAVGFVGR
jgi:hypothetical protein